jgi:hypothetical protein
MKKTVPQRITETELDQPVREYLEAREYTVRGEVNHCDLVAIRDDRMIIVELKSGFNATLLMQAVKRQRMTDLVYIAIPQPNRGRFTSHWKDLCHLVRRLELGLMVVKFQGPKPTVEVVLDPEPFDREKSKRQGRRKSIRLVAEARERHADYNTGGSSRRKIMTVYKENAFQIACYLEKLGPMTPRRLRTELGTGKKTASILQKNYYGWYERVERGLYRITDAGRVFLRRYPDLAGYYHTQLNTILSEPNKPDPE